MALQPLSNNDQIQSTAQVMLAYFDREDVSIPGNLLESIVSGKSLLRALVSGQVVVAQDVAPEPKPTETQPEEPQPKKKRAA